MNKHIFGAAGLSLLLLGTAPAVLLAHEGHDHGGHHRGGYEGDREDSGRYGRPYDDDRGEREDKGEGDEDESYHPSARRYPPPESERSAPRERRDRPW
jgi:hypothetical protein